MSIGHLEGEGMIAIKRTSIEVALGCSRDRALIRSVLDCYTQLQRNS